MDYQHRPGAKTGSGGVASWSETNKDRRERLRQLALETIDLSKDPYFMKNHLGTYECKLCLTLHNNEGSYLAHTQGKKHQSNLARRAAKEAKDSSSLQQMQPNIILSDQKSLASSNAKKKFVKIGRPGYKVTKQRDPDTGQCSLLFQIDYPEIAENVAPRHRFMSAYEQRVEPPDKKWQYLLFAAEPYETVSFKVPSREVDKPSVTGSNNNLNFGAGLMDFKGGRGSGASFVNFSDRKFWYLWNAQAKQFYLQFAFKMSESLSKMNQSSQPNTQVHSHSQNESSTMIPLSHTLNEIAPPPPPPPGIGLGSINLEAPTIPGTMIKHAPPPPPGLPPIP